MGLALALSLALMAQQPPTLVYQIDGSVQEFQLHWSVAPRALILELHGTSVTLINSNTPPKPVSITFDPLQLFPLPLSPPANPYRCTLEDESGDVVLSYQYTSVEYGTNAVMLGFEVGAALLDLMPPYEFIAFDYGAYQELTLHPTSGQTQDIKDVIEGRSESVSGSATFTQALWPWNTLVNHQPNLKVFWPAVRH